MRKKILSALIDLPGGESLLKQIHGEPGREYIVFKHRVYHVAFDSSYVYKHDTPRLPDETRVKWRIVHEVDILTPKPEELI